MLVVGLVSAAVVGAGGAALSMIAGECTLALLAWARLQRRLRHSVVEPLTLAVD